MTHRYYPRITIRSDGSAKFLPFEITAKLYDVAGNPMPPIYFDMPESNGVKVVFALNNYIDELEEAVQRFYNLTFTVKDQNFVLAVKSGVEELLKDKLH